MANMLKIYNRPKDDLSDEEPVDEQKVKDSNDQSPSTLTSIINDENDNNSNVIVVPQQYDEDHKHLNLEKDDEIPKNTTTPIQRGQGFASKINFSVFTNKGMKCQSAPRSIGSNGGSVGGGIVSRCQSLRRLIEGLKCYDAMKETPDSMMEFIANRYREQMLDDFNHFVAEHEQQSAEIVDELIALHQMKRCDVEHCAHSKRHFDETQRVSPYPSKHSQIGNDETSKMLAFYSSKYDALHFALFHLFETGYRVPPRPQREDDDDDDEKVVQQELAAAVSAIKTGRDRCRGALGRFESESNNKFNLSVGVGAESKTEDGHSVKTTTDSMMEYAASNGVAHEALVQINGFMVREDIDTEAAKDDVADSKEESNLFAVTKNHDAFQAVKRYFTLSAGMDSVYLCSLSLCFIFTVFCCCR